MPSSSQALGIALYMNFAIALTSFTDNLDAFVCI